MLLLKNKVDTKYWLENTCEVEGLENKNLILNSKLLSDFGNWNLDYFNFIEEKNGPIMAFCSIGKHKDEYNLLGFQVVEKYRNKNIGNKFLEEIIDYYKGLDNKKQNCIVLATRNDFMKKVALNNGFSFIYKKENTFLKDGSQDDLFKINLN